MASHKNWQTYKLVTALDADEFGKLDKDSKEWLNMIVAAGVIDMREGQGVYEILAKMFDGTKTWKNILTSITIPQAM